MSFTLILPSSDPYQVHESGSKAIKEPPYMNERRDMLLSLRA